ncbi:ABC transporter substrate-binding protein [Mesorhizobium sp. YC-39]|uniref:ABC transporter substrate-binding protein n=1 Tax=unclassified Mesorhizobium TaxID=325217 RepID=UPI0021E7C64E|nr:MULTISPECIES: ABC transporter substrate-binding protein [unclassified Mesorhizobium]MCV3205143.1 ABC transporter substrate-binding protein [Mesorhizobium sp. YC-2]MCV3228458.1 ABC transporter substrate-binding protein [Mesorhizobium sp. YC-39]
MGIIRNSFVGAAALLAIATAAQPAMAQDLPVEPGVFKLAISPWLGYGMWYVAQEKGFFKANGLEGVELTNFVEDKDMGAAIAAGQVNGGNESIQQLLAKVQAGLPVKGVLLLDASTKADAILVNSEIKTVADLKGKQVAFERGSTSDLLLNYILQKNGMTIDDVNVLPMPAASAGTAIISGTVPAAVTYEPYISAAVAADKTIKVLAEAGEAPGLISDVLSIPDETLKTKPGQVQAMLKSWDQALEYYRAHTEEGRAIIAKGVGAEPADLATAFDGVSYYSVAESQAALNGVFKSDTYPGIVKAALAAKLIEKDIPYEAAIDASVAK